MMEWLCQVRKKQEHNMVSYNLILLRIFMIGVSSCEMKGNHAELTLGVGPISGSIGFSIWGHLLP